MSVVTVKLVDPKMMAEFYFQKDQVALAKRLLSEGAYKVVGTMGTWMEGEAAAEELFDLTNNPSRQDERVRDYGTGRSISVGDIVNVDGVDWLCMSMGWTDLVDEVAV